MCIDKNHVEECWISIILRVAMASLFGVAALSKFMGGLEATASSIQGMFKDTWLPLALVTPYSYGIAFVEAFIAVWLLSGIKLRAAWIFTAFILISLAFGLIVAKQSSADIYVYLVMACIGLYFSRYDICGIGKNRVSVF